MISRSTLIGALVVVELAILGVAARAVGGGGGSPAPPHSLFGMRHIGMAFSNGSGRANPKFEAKLDKTFAAGPAPHIVLDVDNASVIVRAGPETSNVHVLGTMTVTGHLSGVPTLNATRTEDGIRVAVESSIVRVRHGKIVREIRLRVPPDAQIEIASAGSVDASGLRGKISAHIDAGPIRVVAQRGDVDVVTGSGDIELLDVRAATVAARTDSGALKLTSAGADHLDAHTDSGPIAAAGLRAADGALATDSGRIDVTFAADSDADVNLHTDDGRISGAGPAPQTEDSADTRSLRLGSARGRFTLSTGSGPIAVSQGAQV